jgi:hypothetical protein
MKTGNLLDMYEKYLQNELGAVRLQDCGSYHVWTFQVESHSTTYNCMGEIIETGVRQIKRYVWLGPKGARYLTNEYSMLALNRAKRNPSTRSSDLKILGDMSACQLYSN